VSHRVKLVTIAPGFPPEDHYDEYRWWTVFGPRGAVEAFISVAEAAGRFVDESPEFRWQRWLDMLRDAEIGHVRFQGMHATIEEDLRTISQRACMLFASGLATFEVVASTATTANASGPRLTSASARRTLVDEFCSKVLRITGENVTRTDIWHVAGYQNASEFERWQRRASGKAYDDGGVVDRNIRSAMTLPPAEFVRAARVIKARREM
jgi:hypothetical protein